MKTFNEISAEELKKMIESGQQPNILDCRETFEYASGHIPGSLNIPVSLIPLKADSLDKSKEWHVICLSGGRSAMVCDYLARAGWKVTNVAGGMSEWTGDVE